MLVVTVSLCTAVVSLTQSTWYTVWPQNDTFSCAVIVVRSAVAPILTTQWFVQNHQGKPHPCAWFFFVIFSHDFSLQSVSFFNIMSYILVAMYQRAICDYLVDLIDECPVKIWERAKFGIHTTYCLSWITWLNGSRTGDGYIARNLR